MASTAIEVKGYSEKEWQIITKVGIQQLRTLRSLIEGYTRLLFFRKFSILPAVIWVYPFINIWDKIYCDRVNISESLWKATIDYAPAISPGSDPCTWLA